MKNTILAVAISLVCGVGCVKPRDHAAQVDNHANEVLVATYAIPFNVGTVTHDPEIPAIGRFMDQHAFSWSGRINDSNMVIRVVPDQAEAARQALLKAVGDGTLKRITVTETKTLETTISEQPDGAVTQETAPSAAP